jgi:tol-pal system protein YbgF
MMSSCALRRRNAQLSQRTSLVARIPSLLFAATFLLAPALLVGAVSPAWAQAETRALLERIERLERDLTVMQRNAARGVASTPAPSGSGSVVITSPALQGQSQPAPAAGPAPVTAEEGDTLARLHLRLSNIEAQMRNMNGQIEEAVFKANAVNQRLDKISADNDLRFREIEQNLAGAPTAAAPHPGPNDKVTLIPPAGAQEPNAGPGAPPRNLGQLTGPEARQAQNRQQQAAAAPPKPPTAKELYDQGLSLHRDGDHAEAEKVLKTFMSTYPKDPLASSAQFWLADTYFQRKEYEQAAILFAEGYKTYPKGNKAPDSLLKLAQSFSALQKKREACIALAQLAAEFPSPAEPIRRGAAVEKNRNGCS